MSGPRWFSTAGADRFGLPGKGRIDIGSDADLMLFDPQGHWEVDPRQLHTEARECHRLFAHQKYRGQVVNHGGRIFDAVRGSFVRPGG